MITLSASFLALSTGLSPGCTAGGFAPAVVGLDGGTVAAFATFAMPKNARELAPKEIATASFAFIINPSLELEELNYFLRELQGQALMRVLQSALKLHHTVYS